MYLSFNAPFPDSSLEKRRCPSLTCVSIFAKSNAEGCLHGYQPSSLHQLPTPELSRIYTTFPACRRPRTNILTASKCDGMYDTSRLWDFFKRIRKSLRLLMRTIQLPRYSGIILTIAEGFGHSLTPIHQLGDFHLCLLP